MQQKPVIDIQCKVKKLFGGKKCPKFAQREISESLEIVFLS